MEWVRRDIAVFDHAHRTPVAKCDLAVVTAARDTDRAALLLAAVHPVGEAVVGNDVIELCRGLVVPRTPRLATVNAHDGALVAHQQNDVRVTGIDPDVLVVVAAGRA